jgi:phosphopantothenoylcysteine decarboxylase/phosphopantothenate--cysteine ligase
MGGESNTVHLVSASGVETWPTLSKTEVARKLVERLGAMAGEAKA